MLKDTVYWLTEHDHLALADLGVEPGRVLGSDLAAVGAGRGQGHLVQQHAVDVGLPHLQGGAYLIKIYSLGRQVEENVCNIFSESSTGSWAELQLPCCPSKQEELSENMLQNLFHNLPPQTVQLCHWLCSVYFSVSAIVNAVLVAVALAPRPDLPPRFRLESCQSEHNFCRHVTHVLYSQG